MNTRSRFANEKNTGTSYKKLENHKKQFNSIYFYRYLLIQTRIYHPLYQCPHLITRCPHFINYSDETETFLMEEINATISFCHNQGNCDEGKYGKPNPNLLDFPVYR